MVIQRATANSNGFENCADGYQKEESADKREAGIGFDAFVASSFDETEDVYVHVARDVA